MKIRLPTPNLTELNNRAITCISISTEHIDSMFELFFLCVRVMGSVAFVTKYCQVHCCRVVASAVLLSNQSSAVKKNFPMGTMKVEVQSTGRGFWHYGIMLAGFQSTRAKRIQIFSLISFSELLL